MSFGTTPAPSAAYRAGELEEAERLAAAMIAADPRAAEAHICLALINLRRNDQAATVASLKACVRHRSAEWVLERVRADFATKGPPSLARDLAFRLGGFFRTQLASLPPPAEPSERSSTHRYVNVVGTSYVRSFGATPYFFPLFIGMGPTMLLVNEEAASTTRRKFRENLRRVDTTKPTLLVIGGDAYYHGRDLLRTRTHHGPDIEEADIDLMKVVAARHVGIFEDARKLVTGQLFFLGATPTYDPFVDKLALILNDLLRPICEAQGVVFLDFWAQLADPKTGHLRSELSAGAYPGDIHYSLATTSIFIEEFKRRGCLPPDVSSAADFQWTNVFECEVDAAERTRIWSEPSVSPNNAFKSDKIASAHLNQRTADLVSCLAAYSQDRRLIVVNARDGHLPASIPHQLINGCFAITGSEADRDAGRMILDFYGRTDIELVTFDEQALSRLEGFSVWGLVLVLNPDSLDEDEVRANAVLEKIGTIQMIIIATSAPERLSKINLRGRKPINAISISNKHIPEKWREYTLVIL